MTHPFRSVPYYYVVQRSEEGGNLYVVRRMLGYDEENTEEIAWDASEWSS
jgi:hypothetical protein